jgi:hypothetical protein
VDADDVGQDAVNFDDMNVESPSGEHLGSIEGFIVDSDTGRPYYIVVDSGGWFRSKHFLLPIGHGQLDTNRDVLVADLTHDRIEKFPGFALDEFDRLTEEDLKQMNDQILQICSVSTTVVAPSARESYSAAWDRPDYSTPDWWAPAPGSRFGADDASRAASSTSRFAEPMRAQSTERSAGSREAGDPSPHYGGRAQPGDVMGIETGGERTYIGDTAEDENKRREAAEDAAAKNRKR